MRGVLLEYGGKAKLLTHEPVAEADLSTAEGKREAKEREKEAKSAEDEARSAEALLAKMDALGDRVATTLSSASVGNVVSLQADAIKQMAEEHAQLSAQLEEIAASGGGKAMREEAHKRQMAALAKQIASLETVKERAERSKGEAVAERDTRAAEAAKATAYNDRVVRETAKLQALETPENSKDIARLMALVMTNEKLKSLEEQFRQTCKQQLADWKVKMAALEAEAESSEDAQRLAEIERTYDEDLAKHTKVRCCSAFKQTINKHHRCAPMKPFMKNKIEMMKVLHGM